MKTLYKYTLDVRGMRCGMCEVHIEEHNHFGVWSFILGFVVMMVLDCL